MSDPAYVYVISIKAPREAVYQALTTPEFIEKYWFGARSQGLWTQGAAIRLERDGGVDFVGEVLDADPPGRLVYTFDAENGEGPSHVTYALETVDGATRLTVTHTGFVDGSRLRVGVSKGWPAVLEGMRALIEARAAEAA